MSKHLDMAVHVVGEDVERAQAPPDVLGLALVALAGGLQPVPGVHLDDLGPMPDHRDFGLVEEPL
jgi:hypothetical protein